MKQLSKLLQVVTVPKARASIVWVIGEYHQHVPLLAPDVLRILAKSFTEEVQHRIAFSATLRHWCSSPTDGLFYAAHRPSSSSCKH